MLKEVSQEINISNEKDSGVQGKRKYYGPSGCAQKKPRSNLEVQPEYKEEAVPACPLSKTLYKGLSHLNKFYSFYKKTYSFYDLLDNLHQDSKIQQPESDLYDALRSEDLLNPEDYQSLLDSVRTVSDVVNNKHFFRELSQASGLIINYDAQDEKIDDEQAVLVKVKKQLAQLFFTYNSLPDTDERRQQIETFGYILDTIEHLSHKEHVGLKNFIENAEAMSKIQPEYRKEAPSHISDPYVSKFIDLLDPKDHQPLLNSVQTVSDVVGNEHFFRDLYKAFDLVIKLERDNIRIGDQERLSMVHMQQQLAQLFFKYNFLSDTDNRRRQIEMLDRILGDIKHIYQNDRVSLKKFIRGTKSTAAVMAAFAHNDAFVIYPDIKKKEEVEAWRIRSGVDFVIILPNGKIVLVDVSTSINADNFHFDDHFGLQERLLTIMPDINYKVKDATQDTEQVYKENRQNFLAKPEKKFEFSNYVAIQVPGEKNGCGKLGQPLDPLLEKVKQYIEKTSKEKTGIEMVLSTLRNNLRNGFTELEFSKKEDKWLYRYPNFDNLKEWSYVNFIDDLAEAVKSQEVKPGSSLYNFFILADIKNQDLENQDAEEILKSLKVISGITGYENFLENMAKTLAMLAKQKKERDGGVASRLGEEEKSFIALNKEQFVQLLIKANKESDYNMTIAMNVLLELLEAGKSSNEEKWSACSAVDSSYRTIILHSIWVACGSDPSAPSDVAYNLVKDNPSSPVFKKVVEKLVRQLSS